MKRLVLLGAPGCGKGTQAVKLAQGLGVPAISTGEMLRGAVAAGSQLGRRVETIMAAGHLVDDNTMAEVVRERLSSEDARKGFLLDGYPRTLPQVATLSEILEQQRESLDGVLLIEVPEEELIARALGRKRVDDTESVVRERLRVYRQETEPLVGHYRDLGLLHGVNGYQTVDRVTADLLAILKG